MTMKDYCGQMIRQECETLTRATIINKGAGSAFAVRVISGRLARFVKTYLKSTETEGNEK